MTKTIDVGNKGLMISIPECYQRVDSMPDDLEGSVSLMAQTESALCLVTLQEAAPAEVMPFDDPQSVINGIHECLGDDQGLIEVKSGGVDGDRWIYSIVKTLKNLDIPEGVQYTLTIDKEYGDDAIHAQGFFDEVGTTGLRDSFVFQQFANTNGFDEANAAWSSDPHDANYDHGILRNKSELDKFDAMFPTHPLTMARELAFVLSGRTSDIEEQDPLSIRLRE